MQATLIKDNLPEFNGSAALYKLAPPLDGNEFVIVSAAEAPYTGPETYIFPASEDGQITDWCELDGSFRGGLDHAQALAGAGYQIA